MEMNQWQGPDPKRDIRPFLVSHLFHLESKMVFSTRDIVPDKQKVLEWL
jgi:hypothetical protein